MQLISGAQVRAARALLRMEQVQLAAAAGISANTVRKIEAADDVPNVRVGTIRALQAVLEAAGIIFVNSDEPGVRMRRRDTT